MKKLLIIALTIIGAQAYNLTKDGIVDAFGTVCFSRSTLTSADITIPDLCTSSSEGCQEIKTDLEKKIASGEPDTTIYDETGKIPLITDAEVTALDNLFSRQTDAPEVMDVYDFVWNLNDRTKVNARCPKN